MSRFGLTKLALTNAEVAALTSALEHYLECTDEPDEDAERILEYLETPTERSTE